MCVVMICDKVRPDEEFVEKAWKTNSHGAGIAWREGKDDNRVVKWMKGLSLDEIQAAIAKTPLPFVAHFRITSTGSNDAEMCHPFEVSCTAVPKLRGTTKNDVLFHNGTWTQWRTHTWGIARSTGVPMPAGEWNDTRSMAWVTAVMGEASLEMINERVVVFGPDRFEVYGTGWSDEKGILLSNKLFLNVSTFRQSSSGGVSTGGTTAPAVGSGAGRTDATVSGVGLSGNEPKEIVISKDERAGGTSLLDLPFRGHIAAFSKWQTGAGRQTDHEKPAEESPQSTQGAAQETAEEGATDRRMTILGPTLTATQNFAVTTWAKRRNEKKYSGHTPIKPERRLTHDGIHFLGLG